MPVADEESHVIFDPAEKRFIKIRKFGLFVKSYGENFLKNFMRSWIGELGGLCCLAGI